ncbi:hypothetical protein JOD64_000467 [Micromonospora luteifusca]|uniref:MafI family immunity protein n=1 Tax=Micromonospora luteifusca TaxID=709860 RepID=A0ABS2LM35_9ACTN|nr:hypothetical protein [Micromonospora luteifusca]MBM7489245.1 hypothetical protein [Micromonospora luteifusca]
MYWTEDRWRFQHLVEVLSGRADAQAEAEMGAPLDTRLADSLVDVMAGEEQLGLDTLCVNVLDYRVRLTGGEYATITDLAERWDLDVRVIGGLNELVILDDASE